MLSSYKDRQTGVHSNITSQSKNRVSDKIQNLVSQQLQLWNYLAQMSAAKKYKVVAPAPPPEEPPAFPMHVMKISDVLEVLHRGGQLPCFEDLKAEGKLIERQPGDAGRVIFFSHTWLGFRHPDPSGVKMQLMGQLLQSLQAGKLKVLGYCHSETWQKGLTIPSSTLQRDFADGYIWLDFWAVPQRDPKAQGLAISSIVDYVGGSDMFIVLAGPWTHEDGSVRDERAWFRRGWCRYARRAMPDPHPLSGRFSFHLWHDSSRSIPTCQHGAARQCTLSQSEAVDYCHQCHEPITELWPQRPPGPWWLGPEPGGARRLYGAR